MTQTPFRRSGWYRAGFITTLGALLALAASAPARAEDATTAGPGRIICKSAKACVMGIGSPATMHYQIDASSLPAADIRRLTKSCTAKGTPCVVTVEGAEDPNDPLKVKAGKITWYN